VIKFETDFNLHFTFVREQVTSLNNRTMTPQIFSNAPGWGSSNILFIFYKDAAGQVEGS